MRIQLITAVAVLLLSAAGTTAQTARTTPRPDDEHQGRHQPATIAPSLAGTWKSAPEEIQLTTDFDKSVWGAGAKSIRTVDLVVRPSGDGTLKVTKKVVDARGRTVPASTWVEEAQLTIGAPQPGIAGRVDHDTKIASAVRLFPDDPNYKWSLDGLQVKVVTFQDGDGSAIEIRYDTPDGKGSFWETLRRDRPAPARRNATD